MTVSPEQQVLAAVAALELVRASGAPSIHLSIHGCSPELIAAARQLEGAESRTVAVNDDQKIDAVTVSRAGSLLGFYSDRMPIADAAPAEVAS